MKFEIRLTNDQIIVWQLILEATGLYCPLTTALRKKALQLAQHKPRILKIIHIIVSSIYKNLMKKYVRHLLTTKMVASSYICTDSTSLSFRWRRRTYTIISATDRGWSRWIHLTTLQLQFKRFNFSTLHKLINKHCYSLRRMARKKLRVKMIHCSE